MFTKEWSALFGILFAASGVFLSLSFYKTRRPFCLIFTLLFAILTFFQFKTTNFRNEYKLLPAEIDLQIQRMNQYPPSLARLGYILEFKKETQMINKLQNNFFNILDLNLYFGNYFSYFLIPFFFTGLFYFFKSSKKFLQIILVVTVVVLSFLGKNGRYGPFLIFPFFILFIIVGFFRSIKFLKK